MARISRPGLVFECYCKDKCPIEVVHWGIFYFCLSTFGLMKKTTHLLITLIIAGSSYAQKSPVFSTKAGAIKGYDPVAYFKSGDPTQGSEEFSYDWMDATWHFSSEENLELFKENPEAFAPQFGGYCSYAVSQGYTYRVSPEAWKIVDGKLYLNYSQGIKKKWEANQSEFIKLANANWPKVLE